MKIRVWNEQHGGSEHSGGDGPYEGFTESWNDNNIRGLIEVTGKRKSGGSDWYDFETDLDVKEGDDVWLVTVIYTTGSTFGRASGNTSYIDVFKSKEEARALEKAIFNKGDDKNNHGDDRWSLKYVNNGVRKECYCSWIGYFESLDDVRVDCLEIYPQGYDEMRQR